jgi:hypothetical protein
VEGTAEVSPRVTETQAFPGLAREASDAQAYGRRHDGGPEEGTRGIVPAAPSVSSAAETKDEAATAAAIGGSSGGTAPPGGKASENGTSQYRSAQP